nr:hypothetical protein VIGAN_07114900 [Ipomoea batatas]
MSFTTTLLLCLKISETSPILPLSCPAITFTVSPTLTCIFCSTGRLFGLQSLRSHRLSCSTTEKGFSVDLTWGEHRGGEKRWPMKEVEERERDVNELCRAAIAAIFRSSIQKNGVFAFSS